MAPAFCFFGSSAVLLCFISIIPWKTACWTVDFYIGALHHELNLCPIGLRKSCRTVPCCSLLASSLLFCLCTAFPAAAEYVCPSIHVVGPAPPLSHSPWLAIPWECPFAPPTLLICCPSIHVADAGAPPIPWKDLLLLPATGPDSWQPPAVSGQLSLGQAWQILPALLLFLFSVSLSTNLCYVRLNEFLISHFWPHLSHLNFSPPPSICPLPSMLFLPPYRSLVFPVH